VNLKRFIAETLAQIAEGVHEASSRVRDVGGVPNPSLHPSQRDSRAPDYFGALANGRAVFLVTFDVGVIVQEKLEGEAGGELRVASIFRGGGKVTDNTATETANRVRFSVPLALPEDPSTTRGIEAQQTRRDATVRAHNQGGGWQGA